MQREDLLTLSDKERSEAISSRVKLYPSRAFVEWVGTPKLAEKGYI